MVNSYKLDLKAALLHPIACLYNLAVYTGNQAVFNELFVDEPHGKFGSVDWDCNAQLFNQIDNPSDVVLMSMSDKKSLQLIGIFDNIAEIWQHNVDTVHFIVREFQATVDNDHFVLVFKDRHVFSDFTKSPNGNHFKLIFMLWRVVPSFGPVVLTILISIFVFILLCFVQNNLLSLFYIRPVVSKRTGISESILIMFPLMTHLRARTTSPSSAPFLRSPENSGSVAILGVKNSASSLCTTKSTPAS